MSYATVEDLNNLGIVASALAAVDAPTKEEAIAAASSRVDGYLRSRWRLPLVTWGSDITEATAVIAVWILMNRRGFKPSGSDVQIRERYNDTLAWLNRVGRQEITPDLTPTTQTDSSLAAPRIITGNGSTCNGGKRGW